MRNYNLSYEKYFFGSVKQFGNSGFLGQILMHKK